MPNIWNGDGSPDASYLTEGEYAIQDRWMGDPLEPRRASPRRDFQPYRATAAEDFAEPLADKTQERAGE